MKRRKHKFILTIYGETDGTKTTGDFSLNSEWFEAAVSYIRIEKGLPIKVWCKRISGEACKVIVRYTHDITAVTPTWVDLGHFYLSSAGEEIFDKLKPIKFQARTGKEAIKFSWDQTAPLAAAKTYIGFEIEFVWE